MSFLSIFWGIMIPKKDESIFKPVPMSAIMDPTTTKYRKLHSFNLNQNTAQSCQYWHCFEKPKVLDIRQHLWFGSNSQFLWDYSNENSFSSLCRIIREVQCSSYLYRKWINLEYLMNIAIMKQKSVEVKLNLMLNKGLLEIVENMKAYHWFFLLF